MIFVPLRKVDEPRWRIQTFVELLESSTKRRRDEGFGERKVSEAHIHRRAIGTRVPDISSYLPTELIFIPSEASREVDRVARACCQLAYGTKEDPPRSIALRLGDLPRIRRQHEGVLPFRIPAHEWLAGDRCLSRGEQ